MSLYGTQRRAIGRYPLGSSSDLFGLGRAIALVRRQIFGLGIVIRDGRCLERGNLSRTRLTGSGP